MRMASSTSKKILVIDGSRFSTLAEAAVEFTTVLGLTTPWRGNLDAFNDFLRGGFGTPEEGFVLVWRNSEISRKQLGYGETLRWLQERVLSCHSSNAASFQERIAAARCGEGETLFDTLVAIVRDHDDIELRLE
jgi:RNAse (barnase) inhibitor barstar